MKNVACCVVVAAGLAWGNAFAEPCGGLYIDTTGRITLESSKKKFNASSLKESGLRITRNGLEDGVQLHEVRSNRELCLIVETQGEELYRVRVRSSKVRVKLPQKKGSVGVGDSLSLLLADFGEAESLFGEDLGMFLTFTRLKNMSFYTPCSSLPMEKTPERQRMGEVEFLRNCLIDEVLVWGDEGKSFNFAQ